MVWLLIDNSNTRTKFALSDEKALQAWRGVLNTAELSSQSLADLLENVSFDAVMICSVVPTKAAVLEDYFKKICPLHFLTATSPLGLEIDYPQPAQIGADRLANAVGVLARHSVPAIVIDFGTAVTFDVISNRPAYCGGVIAPGLGAISGYLTKKTALLPGIELAEPESAIGKSTVQAMQAGAVYGYRGLVKEIILQICKELPGKSKIIATGGDAVLIAKGLPEIEVVDPEITLEGLRQVAKKVFRSRNI